MSGPTVLVKERYGVKSQAYFLKFFNFRLVSLARLINITGPSHGLKIRGRGARSNEVGIMCPPVEIGLTDLPKTGGVGHQTF